MLEEQITNFTRAKAVWPPLLAELRLAAGAAVLLVNPAQHMVTSTHSLPLSTAAEFTSTFKASHWSLPPLGRPEVDTRGYCTLPNLANVVKIRGPEGTEATCTTSLTKERNQLVVDP